MDGHSNLIVLFLGLISLCFVTLTFLFIITTKQVRKTLIKIQQLLPACEETVAQAQRTFAEAQQLLHRTNRATHHVEELVERTQQGASVIVDNLLLMKDRAQAFLKERFGNGVRHRPRRVNRE